MQQERDDNNDNDDGRPKAYDAPANDVDNGDINSYIFIQDCKCWTEICSCKEFESHIEHRGQIPPTQGVPSQPNREEFVLNM